MAVSLLGLAVSCFGLYASYITARFNTGFQTRSVDGTTDNFGPLDAAVNFIPLGITALVAVGIGAALASRNPGAAVFLSLTQMLWVFAFSPGMWIS